MPFEIEHKFLVKSTIYRSLAEPVSYRQGYLAILPGKVVRIRTAGGRGYLTIKVTVSTLTRKEYEYEIPFTDAQEMLSGMCIGTVIEKVRYRIPYEGFIWEVDEFLGENAGLVVAEIEVSREEEIFMKPGWVGEEVTNDPRYLNSNLSNRPFNTWNK